MNQKPIILVTGATGAQGGSVVKALLEGKKFSVRALTRTTDSPRARALKEAGVELVQGDMDDPASLLRAMDGVYGVFGLTSFWEHWEKEYRQGKNLIDAVQQSGISHFVFSALDNYSRLSEGRIPVPHYDMKAELKEYAQGLGLRSSFVHLSYYYENFFTWFLPVKGDDNRFYFRFNQGDTRLASVSVEDTGAVVSKLFDHPAEYIGRSVYLVGADMTGHEYAAIFSKVLELPIVYLPVSREEFAALGFDAARELADMFEVQRLYVPERQMGLIESYGLNPAMQPFERWLEKHKDELKSRLLAQRQEAV